MKYFLRLKILLRLLDYLFGIKNCTKRNVQKLYILIRIFDCKAKALTTESRSSQFHNRWKKCVAFSIVLLMIFKSLIASSNTNFPKNIFLLN